jgi:hypothetical protein
MVVKGHTKSPENIFIRLAGFYPFLAVFCPAHSILDWLQDNLITLESRFT